VGFARIRAENVKINSVVKSMTQYEHYELRRIDAEIAELERKIAVKNEQRREIINRKNLNKINIEVSISEVFQNGTISDVIRRNYPGKAC